MKLKGKVSYDYVVFIEKEAYSRGYRHGKNEANKRRNKMKKFKKDQIWYSPYSDYIYLIEDHYIFARYGLQFRFGSGEDQWWSPYKNKSLAFLKQLKYIGEL